MSVSKTFLRNEELCKMICDEYLSENKPNVEDLAVKYKTTVHNIQGALKMFLTPGQRHLQHGLRVSRAMSTESNAMLGKCGELHHNYKGVISDGHDSQMIKHNGHYIMYYRKVMADAIGIDPDDLPLALEVHHVDGDRMNNDLDNLILCTSKAHGKMHRKYQERPKDSLWEMYSSGTLK